MKTFIAVILIAPLTLFVGSLLLTIVAFFISEMRDELKWLAVFILLGYIAYLLL